jgi:hypothetical protein
MTQNQSKGPEKAPTKNVLSEKVQDMSKLIISKGMVLLEIIKQESAVSDLYLPDTVSKADLGKEHFVVYKLGDDDFKKKHPEFITASDSKIGNIVISLRPSNTRILTKEDREFILVPDSLIECQVTPDNFLDK